MFYSYSKHSDGTKSLLSKYLSTSFRCSVMHNFKDVLHSVNCTNKHLSRTAQEGEDSDYTNIGKDLKSVLKESLKTAVMLNEAQTPRPNFWGRGQNHEASRSRPMPHVDISE